MKRFAMAVALACAACGPESGTSTWVRGTGATNFTGIDARSYLTSMFVGSSDGSGYVSSSLFVFVTPTPARCLPTDWTPPPSPPTSCPESTTLNIYVSSGTTGPIGPGTYAVRRAAPLDPTPFAEVDASTLDVVCRGTTHAATGGTVTVTEISEGRVSGTVDVTLDDGTKMAGFFEAPVCAISTL